MPQTHWSLKQNFRLSLSSVKWKIPSGISIPGEKVAAVRFRTYSPVNKVIPSIFLATLACSSAGLAKEKVDLKMLFPQLDRTVVVKKPAKLLKGTVGQSVRIPTNIYGFAYDPGKGEEAATITAVDSLSPAWKSGLQVGDKIVGGRKYPSTVALNIERNHQRYLCVIDVQSPPKSGTPNPASGPSFAKQQHGDAESAKMLASYAITLLVDSSASMNTKDCPGGISRWQWCRNQAHNLYTEGQGALQSNISITEFNSGFRSHQNCTFDQFSGIFQTVAPAGETFMAPALTDAFGALRGHLYAGRPAVVTVISDGRPSDVDRLKQTIIEEVNSLRDPSLLTVAFIEVGTPERYLRELDNDLINQGAKADIVTVVPFSTINAQGLTKTLASTISDRNPKKQAEQHLTAAANTDAQDRMRRTAANQTSWGQFRQQPQPVQHAPIIRPAPPIKAHPAGTPAGGSPVAIQKPIEVEERPIH